jgi:hypothetical protein
MRLVERRLISAISSRNMAGCLSFQGVAVAGEVRGARSTAIAGARAAAGACAFSGKKQIIG